MDNVQKTNSCDNVYNLCFQPHIIRAMKSRGIRAMCVAMGGGEKRIQIYEGKVCTEEVIWETWM
jgi:hypothetical protein